MCMYVYNIIIISNYRYMMINNVINKISIWYVCNRYMYTCRYGCIWMLILRWRFPMEWQGTITQDYVYRMYLHVYIYIYIYVHICIYISLYIMYTYKYTFDEDVGTTLKIANGMIRFVLSVYTCIYTCIPVYICMYI
jgi:hypothetical protein